MNNPIFTDEDMTEYLNDLFECVADYEREEIFRDFNKEANRRCAEREKARDKQELEFLERFDIRTLDSIEVIDWNDEEIWADDYILNRIKEIQDRLTQSRLTEERT